MREVKFRAWNKTQKLIQEVTELEWYSHYDTGEDVLDIVTTFCKMEDELILMQFTGLLDKNSVEIYEGDIVRINGNMNGIIKYDMMLACYYLEVDYCGEIGSMTPYGVDREVIGNIYENTDIEMKC